MTLAYFSFLPVLAELGTALHPRFHSCHPCIAIERLPNYAHVLREGVMGSFPMVTTLGEMVNGKKLSW